MIGTIGMDKSLIDSEIPYINLRDLMRYLKKGDMDFFKLYEIITDRHDNVIGYKQDIQYVDKTKAKQGRFIYADTELL